MEREWISGPDGWVVAPSYVGTAGLMSDWAAGLASTTGSSWSRMVFSVEMILRLVILMSWDFWGG